MKRRRFLEVVATASSLATTHTVGAMPSAGSRIKVGQIGTKHAHASGQMTTIRELSDTYEVVGVVEPDESRRQQMKSSKAYAGLPWLTEEQLLNTPGLQVVAVETEVRDLLATAQRCVDAGMHIHLDKPAGQSMPRLRHLHRTAKQKSLTIQMGYMFRYNPAFRMLFRFAEQGWLGQLFEVHGVMSKTVGDATRRELNEYRGGSMFELGCHLIDPLLHILGEPQRVTPYLRNTRPEKDSLEDNTLAVFEYPKATATIRSAVVEVDGGRRRQFVVCGDEGTIAIRPLEPPQLELTLASRKGDHAPGTRVLKLRKPAGRYYGAWNDLARVVRGQKAHDFSHEHDLAVQQAILTASGYETS